MVGQRVRAARCLVVRWELAELLRPVERREPVERPRPAAELEAAERAAWLAQGALSQPEAVCRQLAGLSRKAEQPGLAGCRQAAARRAQVGSEPGALQPPAELRKSL